jgi:hypothetical protein
MVKLASLTGYTPGSASVTFGNIKRKIKLLGEGLAASGPATPKKNSGAATPKKSGGPKSTGKRGASKNDETPTKRRKKGDDDDDDDEMFVPKVKKEEVSDITSGANEYFEQLEMVSGYDFEK